MKRVFYSCISALILCFLFIKTCAQSNVIGTPIKIGSIEVAQYDFPNRMKWNDANRTCLNLGQGWRLPTKDEIQILYNYRNQIGNLQDPYLAYWSSTEIDNNIAWYGVMKDGFTRSTEKFYESGVRAVRNSKTNTTQLNEQQTFTFQNGDKYVGDFKNGNRNGQGTYTFSNGDIYVGEWKDGKQNGQGTYTYSNGDKYVGEWKDGNRNGQGTHTFSNGGKYIGNFKDNQWHGQGTHTSFDGSFKKGIYENGVYIGEEKAVVVQNNQSNNNSATTSYSKSSNQSPIIGQPMKVENLLVAQYDFPIKMNQRDAKKACLALGDGWRLPTKDETLILMKYFMKQNILDDDKSYWSSNTYVSGTQITDVNGFYDDAPRTKTDTRYTKIGDGWKWGVYEDSSWYATYIPSAAETSVRAVRSLDGPNSKVTTKSIDKVIKNTKEASNGLTQQDLINLAIRAASGETPNLDPSSPFYSNTRNNSFSSSTNYKQSSNSIKNGEPKNQPIKTTKKEVDLSYEVLSQIVSCKSCGNSVTVKMNIPRSDEFKKSFNQIGGITSSMCGKCNKTSSFTYEMKGGKFVKIN